MFIPVVSSDLWAKENNMKQHTLISYMWYYMLCTGQTVIKSIICEAIARIKANK